MGDGVTAFFHDTSKGLRTKAKCPSLVFQLMFMHMNQLPLSILFCGSSIRQEAPPHRRALALPEGHPGSTSPPDRPQLATRGPTLFPRLIQSSCFMGS